MVKKAKVLIGPLDIDLNKIFKEYLSRKFQVTTLNFIDNVFADPSDINLHINKVSWIRASGRVTLNFLRSLTYDIYHFRFGQSLLPWNLDMPVLKMLGKKIIMIFDGSDLRQWDKFNKDKYNRLLVNDMKVNKLYQIRKRIRYCWVNLWADKIVVATPDLIEFAPEAEYIPNPIVPSLPKSKKERKIIKILHAPSNKQVKGTKYIIKAVNELKKKKIPAEMLLLENIPHNEMIKYYHQTDIVIDQVLIGIYSLVGGEGMTCQKPVISYIRPDLKKYYPDELPIISANPDNLTEKIEELVINQKLRSDLGKKGSVFIKKYHNPEIIMKRWARIYQKLLR